MAKISFVLPVYQNAGSIVPSAQAIAALFRGPLSAHTYEILMVDDGSTDRSWEEIRAAAAADPAVRPIRFTRNFGQLAAMIGGYERATGDAIVNLSADQQDPVELAVEMVRHWEAGSDVVIGYREQRGDPWFDRVMSRIAYGALRWSNSKIPAGGFDFVLMSRAALTTFLAYRARNRFFQADVLWAGRRTTFLPYVRQKREHGRSQWTVGKKLTLFIDFVLDGSYLPIRLMSIAGAVVAALGAFYALLIAISWRLHRTPFPGWAPIMIVLLLVGGGLMLMLGVIGEYVWRILDEVKAKPLYVVDEHAERDR